MEYHVPYLLVLKWRPLLLQYTFRTANVHLSPLGLTEPELLIYIPIIMLNTPLHLHFKVIITVLLSYSLTLGKR